MGLTNRENNNYSAMFVAVLLLCVLLVQPVTADDHTGALNDRSDVAIKQLIQSLGNPQSNTGRSDEENIARILQAFSKTLQSDDKETESLLKDWNTFLIAATHYSNNSYINVMQIQQTIYLKAIAALGDSIEQEKKEEKKYSSAWIDDLNNHFGKDFIRKNQDSVRSCLKTFVASNEAHRKRLKDLMYAEAMLHGSYNEYYGMFLRFYDEKINKAAQKKLGPRKILAETILNTIAHTSITSMYNTSDLRESLADNEARQSNEAIYLYMKSQPWSKTLGNINALDDFLENIHKP